MTLDKKKLLIVSPHFYPMKDGLGAYTKIFYDHIKGYFDTRVLTSSNELLSKGNEQDKKILCRMSSWSGGELLKLIDVVSTEKVDIVLIQYVPFMYARRGGINFGMPIVLLYLKYFKKKQINIMFHELHYPFEWNWKAMLMYFCQKLMLLILLLGSDNVFCSTSRFKKILINTSLGIKKNVFHIPVSTNFEGRIELNSEKIENLKEKYSVKADHQVITLFGGFHPSKEMPFVLDSLYDIWQKNKVKFRVLYAGVDNEKLIENWKENPDKDFLNCLGFLSEEDVLEVFSITDYCVSYFIDGISTRRGSSFACLYAGSKLITTVSEYTDSVFFDVPGIDLVSVDKNDFRGELERIITGDNPVARSDIVEYFDKNFSWNSIIKTYVENISS